MNAEAPKEEKTEGEISEENKSDEDKIKRILDQVKAGDDSLNKFKVQNLDFILDIPLEVTVELGRTKVLVKDLLQWGRVQSSN